MKILGIEHIGIAVKDLANDSPFWKHVLDIYHSSTEVLEDQGVTTDIYGTGKGKVELFESTNPDSPIAKFIDKRGAGIHHVCFEVDDIIERKVELLQKFESQTKKLYFGKDSIFDFHTNYICSKSIKKQ